MSAGNLLKPNTNGDGTGIATTADGDAYGARALRNGTSGDIIPVEVLVGERGA